MALITRVSRLFRADLHAVLDRIEEPEVLLRQAVRDMEDELSQEQQRCKLLGCEHQQLGVRYAELEQSLETLETELDVCFSSNEEQLARTLIRRKLETQRLAKTLIRKRTALELELAALKERIGEYRTRLDHLRQKVELLVEEAPDGLAEEAWETAGSGVSDADVDVAFLREQQNRRAS